MSIDWVVLWWSFAGPFTLGVVACLQLTRLKDFAVRLSAYVLPVPFCMKLILSGSDVHRSAPFFLSGIAATLIVVISVRLTLRWSSSAYTSLALGWCLYPFAAYAVFRTSLLLPPLMWAMLIFLSALLAMRYVFILPPQEDKGSAKPTWGAVAARMTIAFIYINSVVALKGQLGPQWSLALVAFPSIYALTSVLAVKAGGAPELKRFLRSYAMGIPSCGAFALTLTFLPGSGLTVAVAAIAGLATSFLFDQLVE